jgi:histidine ammonia-lyase
VIRLGDRPLALDDYVAIVVRHERVELSPDALERVDLGREALLGHVAAGEAAYGVTTGLGHLASTAVSADDQAALQRSLLTARAAGLDEPLPERVVRGAMLLRLAGFLDGSVGVGSGLCGFLAARLNDGWTPLVPSGPYGAAGEIGPLAHLFQTLLGEGEVVDEGQAVAARDALARRGVEPYLPLPKEGVALVNGSPFATALALHHADAAGRALEHATRAAALSAWATGAPTRAWSPRVARLSGGEGAERVAEQLVALHASPHDATQPPVSLRVVPQVHGALLDALERLRGVGVARLAAVTDSPLVLAAGDDEPAGLYPSGAFHALDVALALEAATVAVVHVVNLAEKRLHRLLDSRFSHLPDQLTLRPGVQAGAVALHKTVVGLAAEARMLAAPASVHALDTSAGQEDVQSYTFLAAARLARAVDRLDSALACELVALRQAAHLTGERPSSPALDRLVEALAAAVPAIETDRALTPDVRAVLELLREDGAQASG